VTIRLGIRDHDGLLVITADPHGVFKLPGGSGSSTGA
jgi:hypothetical protein